MSKINSKTSFHKMRTTIILLSLLFLFGFLLFPQINKNMNFGQAHSPIASPKEIFSLWNDTAPVIDGTIDFTYLDLSGEWSSAGVYNLYIDKDSPNSKVLIQNSNSDLYIALDSTDYTIENPATPWGCAIYLDRDHNGILTSYDRAIFFFGNNSGQTIYFRQFDSGQNKWITLGTSTLGSTMSTYGIVLDTDFTGSYFESINHRQFEVQIPISIDTIQSAPGEIIGIAFEVFTDFTSSLGSTWPGFDGTVNEYRFAASGWGDLCLGKEGDYIDYIYEENTNLLDGVIGKNNGTFLGTADIDGNGDLELIVSSNSSILGKENLTTIYDYSGIYNNITQIWSSKNSAFSYKMMFASGIASYDFDENGLDEIYLVGKNNSILRLRNWNGNDFDNIEYCYTYTQPYPFRGFIDIGDVDNDNDAEIVIPYENGNDGRILEIEYNNGSGVFQLDQTWDPPSIKGSAPTKVHSVKIADMDNDGDNELIYLAQITSDDSIAKTSLQIVEWALIFYSDNPDDDLPSGSSPITEDYFGHSLLVDDINNDGKNDTVLVGKNYLRVFGPQNLSSLDTPLLELEINDNESQPFMGGGATAGDLDGDGLKELIIGCNNGTLFVLNITTTGYNAMDYIVEWSSDVGTSPGFKDSIIVYDIDQDTESELLFGDNFGQIVSLGRSKAPTLSITSPNLNYVFSTNIVSITWDATDDYSIHHYDILTNGTLRARINGTIGGYTLFLDQGYHNLEIIAYDVTGKSSSDTSAFIVFLGMPEVTITSPINNFETNEDTIILEYTYSDLDGNLERFEIYLNEDLYANLSATTLEYTIALDEGQNNITILAIDEDAYFGRDQINITKDTTPPSVVITSHNNGDAVKDDTILIEWSANDVGVGLHYFRVWKDTTLIATLPNTITSQSIDLENDQNYDITVWANDTLGNSWSDFITLTRDTIAPIVNITSPISGYTTNQLEVNIQWTTSDNLIGTGINHTNVLVDGEIEYSGTNTQANINFSSDGIKEIVVSSFDKAGNFANDTILIIIDTDLPFVEIIAPIDNYNTSFNYIFLDWKAYDTGSGIDRFEIFVNSILTHNLYDPLANSTDISSLTLGFNNITIKVYDNFGRFNKDTIFVNYDPNEPTFQLIDPTNIWNYIKSSDFDIEWEYDNFNDLEGFVIYRNGVIINTITDNTTIGAVINLPSEFIMYNITIEAYTTSGLNYTDMFWIMFDSVAPTLEILTPNNESIINQRVIYLSWTSEELGSGHSVTIIKIDGEIVSVWYDYRSSQYLELNSSIFGNITITVEVYDFAENMNSSQIVLQLQLLLPTYDIDLPLPFYTRNGTFSFDLNILEAYSGVKEVTILIDGSEIYSRVYSPIRNTSFVEPFTISNSQYSDTTGNHTLGIVVYDVFSREARQSIIFTVDKEGPLIVGTTTIGNTALDSSSTSAVEIEIDRENGPENYTLSASITDNIGIYRVTVSIIKDDSIETYTMIPDASATKTEGRYSIALNLTSMELGTYAIRINVEDFAGNSYNETYNIRLVEQTVLPWILQGNNLIYVSAGGATALVLIVVLSITLPKTFANMGWKREIVVIAYILNGLPCVYMVNKPEMVKDELLFGGAMTGIRGVLEEITGEKSKLEIQSVEVGQKKVLICPGNFGDAVLMVNKVKPIYKSKLIKFTQNFETYYGDLLRDDPLLTPDTFRGASILVESHFGIVEQMQLIDECDFEELELTPTKPIAEIETVEPAFIQEQPIDEYQQPVTDPLIESVDQIIDTTPTAQPVEPAVKPQKVSIEEVVNQLKPVNQSIFLEIIQLTQNALTNLLEKNIEEASTNNTQILERLEILLKSQTLPDISHGVLRALMTLSQDIYSAIEAGKAGNDEQYKIAVEKASAYWLKEIGDNW